MSPVRTVASFTRGSLPLGRDDLPSLRSLFIRLALQVAASPFSASLSFPLFFSCAPFSSVAVAIAIVDLVAASRGSSFSPLASVVRLCAGGSAWSSQFSIVELVCSLRLRGCVVLCACVDISGGPVLSFCS